MLVNRQKQLEGLQILPSGHYTSLSSNVVSEHEELVVREAHKKVWLSTEPLHMKI